MAWNPLNEKSLKAQVKSQRHHSWDLEADINWSRGVDPTRTLLPLDRDAIAFPGATPEQRLVLSQFLGLVINSTIGEMEDVIPKFRDVAWEKVLREHPVNPEMFELGELFFEEERKHSHAFRRYIDAFCETKGIDRRDLDRLLPKAFGARFLKWTLSNAKAGGFAFWWVVAAVEEVSVEIFREMLPMEQDCDPLFFEIHRKHMEEEARHRNYAFLMLEMVRSRPASLRQRWIRKTDLIRAQLWSTGWLLSELSKIYVAKELADRHPFFATLASSLAHLNGVGKSDLFRRLFVSGPFISLVLNQRHHRLTVRAAESQKVWSLPFPKPDLAPLVSETKEWKAAVGE